MKRVSFLVAALAALPFTACDRTHMTDGYGQALRAALRTQIVDPRAGYEATGPQLRAGLDPQEAAIVHDTYRRSLSPRGTDEAAKKAPVVVMPAGAPGTPAYAPVAP